MANDLVIPVKRLISEIEPEFNSIASYDKEKFQRESAFAFQQLAKGLDSSNEKTRKSAEYKLTLAQSNPMALRFAILGVATLNLTLEPSRSEAYLVPRDGQIALNVGYRGLVKLAISESAITWCKAVIVRVNDKFRWFDEWTKPEHVEADPFDEKARGDIRGVYCAYKIGNEMLFEKMSIGEVYKIRDRTDSWRNDKARPYSPWATSETEMIKKTMIRRASKSWHAGGKFAEAIKIVDQNDGIDFDREREEIERGDKMTDVQKFEIGTLLSGLGRTEEQFLDFFRPMTRKDLTLDNMGQIEAEKAIRELTSVLDNALTKRREREVNEKHINDRPVDIDHSIDSNSGNDQVITTDDIEF